MPRSEIVTVQCGNCKQYFTVSIHAPKWEKQVCKMCRDYAGGMSPRYSIPMFALVIH